VKAATNDKVTLSWGLNTSGHAVTFSALTVLKFLPQGLETL